ncbi:MAG: twin-arginine translocation signal domain-containing protein [Bryobacterales bacterium]|nr:twin-arginine translocation signal domain-containing protein [Bryobacterales bacterium]
MMSRRSFLSTSTAGAAAGSLSTLLAQSPRQQIVSVKAAPLQLLPSSRFGRREFTGDHDPARMRWFGPFSQLTGAILVQIRTDQGITGYGLGGGGGAAVYIIENHLRDLLIGADARNVQLLWDQIFPPPPSTAARASPSRPSAESTSLSGTPPARLSISPSGACWAAPPAKRHAPTSPATTLNSASNSASPPSNSPSTSLRMKAPMP